MNDDDAKIEVAEDRPEVVEETDYALAPDTDFAAVREASRSVEAVVTEADAGCEVESEFAVSAAPENTTRTTATSRTATPLPRRKKPAWTKNPTVALAAAILVGGLAAVVVGKLVLWMLEPSAKPKRYGAVPTTEAEGRIAPLSWRAAGVIRPVTSGRDDAMV